MLFPLNPYTRHREVPLYDFDSRPTSSVRVNYAGTPSDPWHISSTDNYSAPIVSQKSWEMWDVVTQDFTKRIARGEVINNPMEQFEYVKVRDVAILEQWRVNRSPSPPYYYTGYVRTGTIGFYSDYTNPSIEPQPRSGLEQEALTEAWARVSLNEAQILVQGAELHKTVSSIVKIMRKAIRILLDVKSFHLRSLAREFSPKQLKNMYMEARYALRPMVYDINGIISALNGQKPKNRHTFRSFKHSLVVAEENDVLLSNTMSINVFGNYKVTKSIEVRAGVLTFIEDLTGLSCWGVSEPIQAMWELIPFSFIVDWFFNIGKVLASWSPKIGFKTLASWYVVTETTCRTRTATSGENTTYYNYQNVGRIIGTSSEVSVSKYRLPNPDRPTLPVFKINMNMWKTFDLGIIFSQLAKCWD